MRFFTFFLLVLIASNSCTNEDEPIALVVTFNNSSAQNSVNSVTLSAQLAKTTGETEEKGFLLDDETSLASAIKYVSSSSSGDVIETTVNNLQFDKTYFFKPYAVVDGKEFTGEVQSFSTGKVTYSISPLTAGRGQKVKIEGDFLTSKQSDISLSIGAIPVALSAFSQTKMEFTVPDNTIIGSSNSINLIIAGTNIPVTEKLTISNWSVMSTVTTDFFKQPLTANRTSAEYYLNNTIIYFNGNGIAVYDEKTDKWNYNQTNKPTPGGGLISDPVFFNFSVKGYFGLGGVFSTTTGYELNAAATQWSTKSNFPGAIPGWTGLFTNSTTKGYFGLGIDKNSPVANREFWEYDPSLDQWTKLTDYPGKPVAFGVAFVIDDYVFVGGGIDMTASVANSDFYGYSIMDNSWTKVADFPGANTGYAVAFNKKGYVFTIDGKIWIYNKATNSWTMSTEAVPNTRSTRYVPHLWATRDYILIAGGSLIAPPFTNYNDVYRWYPD